MPDNTSPADPRKFPVAYSTGFWSALVLLTNALNAGIQISAEVAGAVGVLIPFVVIGIRWALGKSTAVK